jgi:hypothetical protein
MLMLTDAHYLPSLPDIRRLCTHKSELVRAMALEALGLFGHPDDWAVISQGLNSKDPHEFEWHAIAARSFGDLRAAEALIPHLAATGERERQVSVWALMELPSPAMLEAVDRYAAKAQEDERKYLEKFGADLLAEMGCTREQYGGKTKEEKEKAFVALYVNRSVALQLKPDDQKLGREDFLHALQEWKKNRRIFGGAFEWVKDRHILAVATAEDIPAFMDIRASMLELLSDECLQEVQLIERVVGRIGRSRYRKEPALTAKVETATRR